MLLFIYDCLLSHGWAAYVAINTAMVKKQPDNNCHQLVITLKKIFFSSYFAEFNFFFFIRLYTTLLKKKINGIDNVSN